MTVRAEFARDVDCCARGEVSTLVHGSVSDGRPTRRSCRTCRVVLRREPVVRPLWAPGCTFHKRGPGR